MDLALGGRRPVWCANDTGEMGLLGYDKDQAVDVSVLQDLDRPNLGFTAIRRRRGYMLLPGMDRHDKLTVWGMEVLP